MSTGTRTFSLLHDAAKRLSGLKGALDEEIVEMYKETKRERKRQRKGYSYFPLIPLCCICSLPESYDKKMIQCDVCKEWYHFKCVNIITAAGN